MYDDFDENYLLKLVNEYCKLIDEQCLDVINTDCGTKYVKRNLNDKINLDYNKDTTNEIQLRLQQLRLQLDECLDNGDKKSFIKLSQEYNFLKAEV
jgi:uncharacterized protein YpiB (UPF0302 family)